MLAQINAKFQLNKLLLLNKKLIVNAIAFQIVWFICVQGNNLNAALAAIALLSLHQLMFKLELKTWPVLIGFSLLGFLGDSALAKIFQLDYSDHLDPLAPLWLLCLWLSFATTANHSMKWLFSSPYLTVFVAIFIVPISYLVGIKLSASTLLGSYPLFYISEGIWWAVLLIVYGKLTVFNEVKHV